MNEQIALFPGLPPLEEVCGLTPWSSGPPPSSGWWKTRLRTNPAELMQPQRRWYDAKIKTWSRLAMPHFTDDECAIAKELCTGVNADNIEWCGLAQDPAPWLRGEKQP